MRLQRSLLGLKVCALSLLVLGVLFWPRTEPANANPLTGVVAVAAGGEHTCALTTTWGVMCWGWNGYGQLGDGTTTSRTTAVTVAGLSSGVAAVSTGNYHSCALTASGGVKCWGRNLYGQLGDGTTTSRSTPVAVAGLGSDVVAIAAGQVHTCALTGAQGVLCWGNNYHGQLGTGQIGNFASTPADVPQLTSGVAAVTAGNWHTCAVTTSGGAKCWGENLHGQVGDGTFGTNRTTPVNVSGLGSSAIAITGGEYHTCALTSVGAVKCWGRNTAGQVGDGTMGGIRSTPVGVVGLDSGAAAVAAGSRHTCAVTTAAAMKCWGQNDYGQLGEGQACSTFGCATPVDVSGLTSGVATVSAGSFHTCAVTTAGGAKCWGRNESGQLGTWSDELCALGVACSSTPIDVLDPEDAVDSDLDGCADKAELRTAPGSEAAGGGRDPLNYWDVYDTPLGDVTTKDRVVNISDVARVVARFGANDGGGAGTPNRNDDPTSTVLKAAPAYHPALDRGVTLGPNPWNLSQADGVINISDVARVVAQFSTICA